MDILVREKQKLKYSNVDWCGNIPIDWRIEKVKAHFNLSKERASFEDNDILSLTQKGIKVRDISGNEGQVAASYDNYAKLRKGDIVLNPMDLISGYVDLASQEGIISPAYTILRKKKTDLDLNYAKHFLQWHYIFDIFFPFGKGVSVDHRWTLGNDILLNFPMLIPSVEEQKRIADFLDRRKETIEKDIRKKQKLIELLKEQRTAIITESVFKGIDLNKKLKESGIEWIGKIPENWTVKRARFLFRQISETNHPNAELLSVYRDYGVIPKTSRDDNNNKASEDLTRYKFVKEGNLVFNKMKTWQGSIAVSRHEGIVSPAYYVAEFIDKEVLNPEFAHFLLRSAPYISKYGSISTGIRPNQWDMGFDAFKDVHVLLPPLKLQQSIVKYIENKTSRTDILIEKVSDQIKKLKEYRASLIYNAVTGKIKI